MIDVSYDATFWLIARTRSCTCCFRIDAGSADASVRGSSVCLREPVQLTCSSGVDTLHLSYPSSLHDAAVDAVACAAISFDQVRSHSRAAGGLFCSRLVFLLSGTESHRRMSASVVRVRACFATYQCIPARFCFSSATYC